MSGSPKNCEHGNEGSPTVPAKNHAPSMTKDDDPLSTKKAPLLAATAAAVAEVVTPEQPGKKNAFSSSHEGQEESKTAVSQIYVDWNDKDDRHAVACILWNLMPVIELVWPEITFPVQPTTEQDRKEQSMVDERVKSGFSGTTTSDREADTDDKSLKDIDFDQWEKEVFEVLQPFIDEAPSMDNLEIKSMLEFLDTCYYLDQYELKDLATHYGQTDEEVEDYEPSEWDENANLEITPTDVYLRRFEWADVEERIYYFRICCQLIDFWDESEFVDYIDSIKEAFLARNQDGNGDISGDQKPITVPEVLTELEQWVVSTKEFWLEEYGQLYPHRPRHFDCDCRECVTFKDNYLATIGESYDGPYSSDVCLCTVCKQFRMEEKQGKVVNDKAVHVYAGSKGNRVLVTKNRNGKVLKTEITNWEKPWKADVKPASKDQQENQPIRQCYDCMMAECFDHWDSDEQEDEIEIEFECGGTSPAASDEEEDRKPPAKKNFTSRKNKVETDENVKRPPRKRVRTN